MKRVSSSVWPLVVAEIVMCETLVSYRSLGVHTADGYANTQKSIKILIGNKVKLSKSLTKLDGVGPVKNRPSTE